MASVQDYAALSQAVYDGPGSAKTPLPAGWVKIAESKTQSGNAGSTNGYFGAAYKNESTGEIVIANRGSRLSKEGFKQDWFGSDMSIVAQDPANLPPAFADAEEFAMDVISQNLDSKVSFTGHSLGGAEAQVQAAGFGGDAVTFGAPGVAFAVPDEQDRREAEDRVVNYVLPGDPVTLCGDHIGKTVSLTPTGWTAAKMAASVVLGGLISGPLGLLAAAAGLATTHMLGNYIAAAAQLPTPDATAPANKPSGARTPSASGGGGRPAARVFDPTMHGPPLMPGPGSPNVLIGGKPAWRGLPAGAAAALQSAQAASDTTVKVAEAVTVAAAGSPGAPAAYAAEQAAKTAAAAAMSSLMSGLAASAAASTGGMGTPDMHICPIPTPVPPHGPGYVIDGSQTVLVNGLPLCRQGDTVLEALGGPDKIALGELTVLIGG